MKKTMTVAALSSVLVLGVAASSFAAAAAATTTGVVAKGASAITLDGSIRQRGMYDKDNPLNDTPGRTGYDTRVQLGVQAKVSDQATGYLKLENGAGNSDIDTWGNASAVGLTNGGNKMGGLNILEAWINYQPGVWGVKAGHMPLALGNKVFFDHTLSGDDALVFYVNPSEATHIGALTIKFDEQNNGAYNINATDAANRAAADNSDDLNGYVALITHKLSDSVNLGANWTYLRGGSTAEAGQPVELLRGLAMSNIGLTADGKIGAISYMADAEFQFGTFSDNGVNTQDASGWAMKLGGNYDLGGGKVGLLFGYGSGKDQRDSDLTDAIANNETQDQFINFLGDTTYDTIITGFRSPIPGAGWSNATGRNSGLSNLTIYQLNGSTKVACPLTGKDLSIFGSLSYLQLSEDITRYLDTAGNPVWVNDVGTEIDLIANWALTPGLSYKVEIGYLIVGDAYETAGTGAGKDPDDLKFIRNSLELKF